MLARAKWDRPCGQNSAEHVHNNLSSLNRGAAESGCGGQCAVQERKERAVDGRRSRCQENAFRSTWRHTAPSGSVGRKRAGVEALQHGSFASRG